MMSAEEIHRLFIPRCKYDHYKTPENTYEYTDKLGHKHRGCRICRKVATSIWRGNE